MPSSNLRPPSGWPAAWTQALDYLAAGLDTDYVLASAGTRQALATDMRKAQAMRESLYAFPSWPGPVKAMLRTHKIRLERRFTFGRWFLHICAEPLRPDLSQMFLLALQNTRRRLLTCPRKASMMAAHPHRTRHTGKHRRLRVPQMPAIPLEN